MNAVTPYSLLLLALPALVATPAAAQCDTRTPIVYPTILSAPWNKICYVENGSGRGTGHLVGPYAILTNGHVVYDRDSGSFYARSGFEVSPAQYESDGSIVRPWGTRSGAARLATNTRYTGASDGDAYKYDYGAIFIDTPFSGLTVFMPLQFDYLPSGVNMSGYPATSPSGSSTSYQLWESDTVYDSSDRNIWYWIRSVGGASGSPLWRTISGERRQVGINRGHPTGSVCKGTGVRLIDANCTLIRSWMEWTPASLTGGASPERGLPRLDDPRQLLSPEELHLFRPVADLVGELVPARRVLQHIDGVVYDWEEHEIARRRGAPLIAVHLRSPIDKVLDLEEARILLSASRRWRLELAAAKADVLPATAKAGVQPLAGPPTPAQATASDEARGPDVEIAR